MTDLGMPQPGPDAVTLPGWAVEWLLEELPRTNDEDVDVRNESAHMVAGYLSAFLPPVAAVPPSAADAALHKSTCEAEVLDDNAFLDRLSRGAPVCGDGGRLGLLLGAWVASCRDRL